MTNIQSTTITTLGLDELATVIGGAGTPAKGQTELRQLAAQYCPATYAKFKGAAQITRPMGERCLDEAGLGMFKGRLDQYFPKK